MDGRIVSRLRNDHSVPKTEVRTYLNTHSTHSLRDESDTDIPSPKPKKVKLKPLDEAVQAAMKRSEKDLQRELGFFHCPEKADFQDRVTINNHEFTTYRTSESHGVIFFQDAGDSLALVPGIVRAIFQVIQDNTTYIFLAVNRYLTPMTSLPDPLARYPEFGASLWSSEMQKEVTIVPGSQKIYHAIYRDWDYRIMVMKPLNRVNNIISDGRLLANLCSFPRTFDNPHLRGGDLHGSGCGERHVMYTVLNKYVRHLDRIQVRTMESQHDLHEDNCFASIASCSR